MMTRVSHRHRGIATALLREAERIAIARERWLLVLDTAEDEGAAGLYERMGFKLTGLIPDYALKPHGGLTGTLIYWKRLQRRWLRPNTLRNRQKIRRLQAGAADQRAVDVGDRHQFRRVGGLHRAAVENPDLATFRLESAGENTADKAMNLLDISRRRRQPGADRPDRLIGHHQIGRRRAVRQRTRELPAADIQRLAGIALLLGLADADDRDQPRPPGRFRLLPDQRVGLAMVGAPLGMPDDDGAGAGIRQHFRREIAGMGARRLRMAILGPDGEF